MSCLAIGPGLGRSAGVTEFVQGALAASRVPTVVDADALWALSRDMSSLEDAACPWSSHRTRGVRHAGRACSTATGSLPRAALPRAGAVRVVLKGSGSVVAFPDGECYVNQTGNPGMARGGSGDVLTGLMAAMLCQLPFRDAVRAAVYIRTAWLGIWRRGSSENTA
ncbi:MAG: NAD(P)H-hydrate dehydratase [Lachnospiraceae bacterium]